MKRNASILETNVKTTYFFSSYKTRKSSGLDENTVHTSRFNKHKCEVFVSQSIGGRVSYYIA